LFEGPSGIGKYLHAMWLSKLINCLADKEVREKGPCGSCWSCRMIDKGEHSDVVTVGYDPEKTSKIISVRQARKIISEIQVHPFRARKRVVIIDPAEAMRIEAANAMLKTFEEPPSSTMFILICDFADQLLPTIRSRVQRIRFRPVPREELEEWLLLHQSTTGGLSIPMLSEGAPGQALLLMEEEEEWLSLREEFLSVIQKDVSAQIDWVASFCSGAKQKWLPTLMLLLDVIATLLRDWVLLSFSSTLPLYHEDIRARLSRFHHNPVHLGTLFESLAQIHRDLQIHVNGKLLLEAFFAQAHTYLVASRSGY
jgi:DNA polymerase-3 subunit delta'